MHDVLLPPRAARCDVAEYLRLDAEPVVMQATSAQRAAQTRSAEARDWVDWYDSLSTAERQELRARLLDAGYDDVKSDADLRNYFFFHVDDVVAEMPPGSERLAELHTVVQRLRGAHEPELVEKRRKAVAFLLGEYQRFLRDNPWSV